MKQKSARAVTFIGHWPDYETAFFSNGSFDGYQIKVVDPLLLLANYCRPKLIFKPLRTWLVKRITRALFKKYSDTVIVVHESRNIVEALDRMAEQYNVNIIMRNIYDPEGKTAKSLRSLQQKNYLIWSFDDQDCSTHGFQQYYQFAEKVGSFEDVAIENDFCFFGRDKGRRETLMGIKAVTENAGFSCQLEIKNHTKKDKANINSSYHTYLQHLCSARCIIDIVQNGQSGSTLRPLEAALYNRKLLTNNQSVTSLATFNANNVLTFDRVEELTPEKISAFMNLPLSVVSPEQMRAYSLKDLLDKLCVSA